MSDTMPACYYWGCWNSAGHGCYTPTGRNAAGPTSVWYPDELPWKKIDGWMAPGARTDKGHLLETGTQSDCALYQKDGWTALAMHDFTVDSRPNSNSVFFFEATLDFEGALAAAMEEFPRILIRIARARPLHLIEQHLESGGSDPS